MYLSDQGTSYRAAVGTEVLLARANGQRGTFRGPVTVDIDAHPPNLQRRDIDNLLKATLDAIQAAGLIENDAQVADLRIRRRPPIKWGRLIVTITTHQEPPPC